MRRRKRIEIMKENEESIEIEEIDEIHLLCVRMSCILLFIWAVGCGPNRWTQQQLMGQRMTTYC